MRLVACLAAALAGFVAAAPPPARAQTTVTIIDPSDDDVVILRRPRYDRPRYAAPDYRRPSYDAGTGIVPPLVDTYTPTQRAMPYAHPYHPPVIFGRPVAPAYGPAAGPPPAAAGPGPRR